MSTILRAVKAVLRRTPLLPLYRAYQQNKTYREWVQEGRPVPPPPAVKQRIIKEYARRFKLPIFVETGTYLGDTVEAVRRVFDVIYSIELSTELYEHARRRFAGAKHITILHGDSGEVLQTVLPRVEQPCLFWLDGHYSADVTAKGALDTPIQQELDHIFKHPLALSHVILIDDARLFTGKGDYPAIETLRAAAHDKGFDSLEVADDIVRICKVSGSGV